MQPVETILAAIVPAYLGVPLCFEDYLCRIVLKYSLVRYKKSFVSSRWWSLNMAAWPLLNNLMSID